MNEFDSKAGEWDKNPMHWQRSVAITDLIKKLIPLNKSMVAMEYGAGTGMASFLLKDNLREITLIDSSSEMVRITAEKIKSSKANNLKTLYFDLAQADYNEGNFDLIFSQLVLHHVADVENILRKFYYLLNPGGYIAIADLYLEDGSFHGDGFTGPKGFDTLMLSEQIRNIGFINITHQECFVINRQISESETKQFRVFLLIANR